jgi:hypothetical protein
MTTKTRAAQAVFSQKCAGFCHFVRNQPLAFNLPVLQSQRVEKRNAKR